MKKPVLVIMAAGMGSRYGGLKQMDAMDDQGHVIIDFSIYDAKRAGFETVIFIIKKENEEVFRQVIGSRIEKFMEVRYVYQELDTLPAGFFVPEGRVKPWGTGHAVLSCKDAVDGPFAVINADDYYGKQGYQLIYDYLCSHEDDSKYRYCMAGYRIENTLSENGHVARGICETDEKGQLVGIVERTRIIRQGDAAAYSLDEGITWNPVLPGTAVSMNLFGFTRSLFGELEGRFSEFLKNNLHTNPLKCEYFLPFVIDELIREEKACVQVLKTGDKWYGVTYREDKETVMAAIAAMKKQGLYPERLWQE